MYIFVNLWNNFSFVNWQPLAKCSVNEDAVDAHREAAAVAGANKTASPGHVTETEDDQSWAKYTNFQIL